MVMKRISGTIPVRLVICLIVAVLLAVSAAWAKPTTPDQAKNVVLNWLAKDATPLGARLGAQGKEGKTFKRQDTENWPDVEKAPLGAPPGPQIKEVKTFYHQDTPAYYVVYLNPSGLVFLPADDLVEPIIGFMPEGYYDPSPVNPLGALVSRDIPGRVVQAREVEAKGVETLAADSPHAKARRKWAWLEKSTTSGTEASEFGIDPISDVRVASFVNSRWNQAGADGSLPDPTTCNYPCYNYFTPPYAAGDARNYVSGCVATALSQLIRYCSYPTSGIGKVQKSYYIHDPYNYSPLPGYTRGGDDNGGAYVWTNDNMPYITNSSTTPTQRAAIGRLLWDVGISVGMNYDTVANGGSGTDTLKAADALVNTFQYSNAKKGYNSGSNLLTDPRNAMVNPNLHAGYPILFGITNGSSGHAIVCDGYGYNAYPTMYHHLNMGWSGSSDLWYNLPNIGTGYNFNSVYKCIYNVYTSGTGEIIAGRVTDSAGNPISGVTVTATGGGHTYPALAATSSSGIYAIPKVLSGTTFTVSASKTGYTFTSQSVLTGTSPTLPNYSPTTGNRWGIDFVAGSTPTPTGRVLFNNGPLVNSPGTGAGGADESNVQQAALGMDTFGINNAFSAGYRIADDFRLASRSQLQKIKFYAYQTGSTTTSTITAVNLRIWNGPPDNPASTVIYGDTTTNRMTNATWANIYRVRDNHDTTRPVMVVTASIDVTLNPGTYWLDWQVDGSASLTGPWAPPITRNGQTTTGNALQYTSIWAAASDSYTGAQQGFPFIIEGKGGANLAPLLLLLIN